MHRKLFALFSAAAVLSAQSDKPITGFSAEGAKQQQALESRFDSSLNRQDLQEWLKRLSAKPHHLGSPYGKEVAEFIAAQFKSWGFDTQIETFYPLFPTPKTRLLELTAPEKYTAKLEEPAIEGDESTGKAQGGLPVYNAYSIDGDVTAPLVYVNYGLPRDYDKLAEMGIDVKGKIVIARYGASWRGIKPKVAAEHGALACIIYSDPRDDGYFQGDVYPKGGWRPRYSAQRGSVMDMPTYPGDPLTPNVGAVKDAKRPADYRTAETLTKIPVLPISYGDAEPLLRALTGPVPPADWRGALPFTYHIGPGPATVHMKLEFNWNLAPLYNVIAKLPGSERPDEWVIRGNHHDGWVFGASDPLTGMVAVMEEAKAVGMLAKSGWRPKRTMIYAAWDGEEPALLGSTEWVEQHADELRQHAAIYINSDTTARGFLGVGGSHTLEHFVSQVARDLTDPETKTTTLERAKAAAEANGRKWQGDMPISPLGSGSDYTPFLQHLGIPCLNIGFGGEGNGSGSYHSNYDTYDHVVKFEDPDFEYMLATSKLGGRMMLRFASADTLPLRFDNFTRTVSRYVAELQKLADDMRTETSAMNDKLSDGAFTLSADPRKVYIAPQPKGPVPFLSFAPLQNAMTQLEATTAAFSKLENKPVAAEKARALDDLLLQAERTLIRDQGLPRRPWYKHQIYAPGYYTGYGVKTIPGVREAIEERQWQEADQQIRYAAEALGRMTAQIDKAVKLLSE